jgi:type IV pilus assembly protein PilV
METRPMVATERSAARQLGFTMLEAMVSIFILVTGLLGLLGLHVKSQAAELESYQRAQALVLVYDMVDKIKVARVVASCFAQSDPTTGAAYYGTAGAGHIGTPNCAAGTTSENGLADAMMSDWDAGLNGAGETKAGASVGGALGARGCVSYDPATEVPDSGGIAIPGTGEYLVAVSWQGQTAGVTPSVNCANGLYGSESNRRTVSLSFRIASTK